MRGTRALLAVLVGAWTLAADPALADAGPAGYRMDNYRAPTPSELPGATVVDTDGAEALVKAGAVIPINVLNLDRGTLPGSPWLLAKPRPVIPGTVWLPNVGVGAPSPEVEAYFRANLDRLAKDRPGRGFLFYCLADCWISWNAAKRAIAMGYADVHWYPEGIDGWTLAGLDTEPGRPVPFAE